MINGKYRNHMSSANRVLEPCDPDALSDVRLRPLGLIVGGVSGRASSEKGFCSWTGVRFGPDRMIITPLSGRIGDPSCSRCNGPPKNISEVR